MGWDYSYSKFLRVSLCLPNLCSSSSFTEESREWKETIVPSIALILSIEYWSLGQGYYKDSSFWDTYNISHLFLVNWSYSYPPPYFSFGFRFMIRLKPISWQINKNIGKKNWLYIKFLNFMEKLVHILALISEYPILQP